MADIFISYKREDEILAKSLAEKLSELGWSVWWDHNIPAGKDYDKVIEQELDSSKCVIVLWTERSLESRNVKDEAHEALSRNIYIPVLVGNVRPPLGFRMIQAIKWNDNNEVEDDEMDSLLKNIFHLIGEPHLNEQISTQVEKQDKFTVIIKNAGSQRINVIRTVKNVLGLGLTEAKNLVESGKPIIEIISRADAEKLKADLEDLGAMVEIK